MPQDVRAATFVTAMLRLAGQLGLDVVAEGIETAEQLEFLRGEHAGLGQGYHLGRPVPAGEVTALLLADQLSGRSGAPS